MPRYNYKCSNCEHESVVFHSFDEQPGNCTECVELNTLTKQLTTPLYTATNTQSPVVGELTVDYIEQNRQILEEEKAKRETYEPT